MDEHGPRISRSALARMTGVTALGLAVAPEVASAARSGSSHDHLHRSSVLTDGRAGDVGMDADALEDAFARVARRATDGRYPGAVALVARRGVVVGERAFGVRLAGSTEATTIDTLYDLESMTKVLATATAAMMLVHRGRISLTAPGGQVPAGVRDQRQGRRARPRPPALLVRIARGRPEGRHRRHRRDLEVHARDAPRVSDRDDGRVLGSRLPAARPPDRDGRRQGSRHVREEGDLGPARHDRHDLQPGGGARATLRCDRAGLTRASAPGPCGGRCRTTRIGKSAASSAATARSRLRATWRSSAR